jgi:anaerobic selenocysteine-containing dehydrogenase
MWPDLYCQIHPEKAAAIGATDGQRLRIETAAGAIEARAWITRGIRPTAVFLPIGWGDGQPYHPWTTVNRLTGRAFDPISDQANLKLHLCRVSAV